MESGIYVVATPIGNLGDISLRALEVLRGVDMIAAEDTRHTKKLLEHFDITKKMLSLHDHNEAARAEELVERVEAGASVALVSDAGTPLISDPGHLLVSLARKKGVSLIPVPGPSAVITALSVGGVPCGKFIFEGFLPAKDKAKKDALAEFESESRSVVFYESPHRVLSTIEVMSELYPDRTLVVARELTKRFETIKTAPVSDILDWIKSDENQRRGEFVLVLQGASKEGKAKMELEQDKLLARLLEELPPKKAAAIMSELFGESKKKFYNLALEMKKTE